MDYIERNGHQFAGESFDDNVSGMTFERNGIEEIYRAAAEHRMNVVLVKDLSRLGREKIQTAMFIEYLRSHNIRVISVTDNTDSFNEDDEFRMDMNQFINHMYARDVSKRSDTVTARNRRTRVSAICLRWDIIRTSSKTKS